MRSIANAFASFRRAPLLGALSVTTIAFSLFAFGLFALVAVNIRAALDQAEERVELRAYITEGTSPEAIVAASSVVGAFPEVQRVQIVTQEQALARARQELGEFRDVFDAEFLPASLDIHLRQGHRDPTSVQRVSDRIRAAVEIVDDVRYGEEWIRQLYRLRNIAGIAGATLGAAFAAVALIIIGATIRMAVLARAREISIMRLVGATDGYIRRPFLIDGMFKGILGGMLALGMTWGALRFVQQYLNFETAFFDTRTLILGVALGAAMGWLGSVLSVGRQLRKV